MTDNSLNRKFYANGKLMLTGEYLVLVGAEAIALPLRRGQELLIRRSVGRPALAWKTYVQGNYWFDVYFSLPELAIANTNDFPTAQNLREIFLAVRELNPGFPDAGFHYEISSNIDFNLNWGFGSSSSLLVTIAKWADVNPFDLHFKLSKGSGYDIAAALSDHPVLYKLQDGVPSFHEIDFDPLFKGNIFFGFLGKKRNSITAVNEFLEISCHNEKTTREITDISMEIIQSSDISGFIQLLRNHDKIISRILKLKPIAETRFPDFKGYVKSLGAWGGDFALFVSDHPREYILNYFRRKDIKIWFGYEDIVESKIPGADV